MSDSNNNPQGNSSQQGQDPASEADKDTKQDSKTQGEQSDKDKNFEAVRKQLEEKDKIIAQYKQKETDAEKKKLEEQGNFKELLETEKKEKLEIKAKYESETRHRSLEKELTKSGINAELIDLIIPKLLPEVNFNDSNIPQNLTEVVENLKKTKPSLFIETTTLGKIGAGLSAGQFTSDKDPSEMSLVEFAQYRAKNN